jgi:hypothetical protein
LVRIPLRWLLGSVVLALIAAVGASAAVPAGRVSPPALTRHYADATGWSARYPAAFHREVSDQELGLSFTEATIANFALRPGIVIHRLRHGASWRAFPALDPAGRFPPDGVALRVVTDTDDPFAPTHRNFRYPIRLAGFAPSDDVPPPLPFNGSTGETETNGTYHGVPRSVARELSVPGEAYTAVVWIGPQASPRERADVARIVASLRIAGPRSSSARAVGAAG